MTNELEKQFFDTFGIPRLCSSAVCKDWGDCEACLMYPSFALDYPQITDRILLELICIINRFDTYFDYYYQEEYQVLRETILEDSINLNCKLKQTDFSKLKRQVQALFEEG